MLPGGVGQSCRLSQVVPFTSRAVLPIRFRETYGCAAVPSLLPVQVTIGRGRGERIAMHRCHALYPTTRTCITRFERRSLICAGLRAGPANATRWRWSIVPPVTGRTVHQPRRAPHTVSGKVWVRCASITLADAGHHWPGAWRAHRHASVPRPLSHNQNLHHPL
ncbi:MAG: hypothetical protein KatS3mg056_1599 [Chloroflexus sp.]|nr:MAG: hypothetical protein KatS3mg056_1599 [Chloroflexus sp.]